MRGALVWEEEGRKEEEKRWIKGDSKEEKECERRGREEGTSYHRSDLMFLEVLMVMETVDNGGVRSTGYMRYNVLSVVSGV